MRRGQSHVVGVALMLSVTVIALGTITASIGTVFDAQAAGADARRVAAGFDSALEPVESTGPRSGTVAFTDGSLQTEERTLRVYRNGSLEAVLRVDTLVFRAEDRRVAATNGAIVRGRPGGGWLYRKPPIVAGDGVLAIGVVQLNASDVSVSGTGRTTLETDVHHERVALGPGRYEVWLETETPGAFEPFFERANATVSRRDPDGDGIPSVVARYPRDRIGYLVVHDLRLEVWDG